FVHTVCHLSQIVLVLVLCVSTSLGTTYTFVDKFSTKNLTDVIIVQS
ncbi:Os02g0308800, partial [Oryza sativa Japonica Group]